MFAYVCIYIVVVSFLHELMSMVPTTWFLYFSTYRWFLIRNVSNYLSALAAASQYLSVAEYSVVTSDALKAKLKLLL